MRIEDTIKKIRRLLVIGRTSDHQGERNNANEFAYRLAVKAGLQSKIKHHPNDVFIGWIDRRILYGLPPVHPDDAFVR